MSFIHKFNSNKQSIVVAVTGLALALMYLLIL